MSLGNEDLKNQSNRNRMKLMHLKTNVFPLEHLFFRNEMSVSHFCNVAVKKNRRGTREESGPISDTD